MAVMNYIEIGLQWQCLRLSLIRRKKTILVGKKRNSGSLTWVYD